MKEFFTHGDFSSLSGALIGMVQQLQELRLLWPMVTGGVVVVSMFSVGQYQIAQNAKEIEKFRNVVITQAQMEERLSSLQREMEEQNARLETQIKKMDKLIWEMRKITSENGGNK